MARSMLNRILREPGAAEALELLGERLSSADLQSFLLEVFARRAEALEPKDVARQFETNRFVPPSTVSARVMHAFDGLAFEVLPAEFDLLDLSPVSPLGASSALATIHQDQAVSTQRNVEVCSDPTNVFALIAAARRRKLLKADPRSVERVRLAASHRVLRPQKFDMPNAWSHFRLFALATAGRDAGSHTFEFEGLREHIDVHVRLLERAREAGYRVASIHVGLTNLGPPELEPFLDREVLQPLRTEWSDVEFAFDPERERGRGYYQTACFVVNAIGADGEEYFLADGGFTDWTAKLLASDKERLLISGLGSERFCACLAPSATP